MNTGRFCRQEVLYTATGTYQDTIPNASQCDSVITVNLTVLNSSGSTLSASSCGSYLSPAGNTYTASGTYSDTIPNAAQCDSVITINLTINLVINSADTTVNQAGSVLTAASSGAAHQWIDCTNNGQPVPGAVSQSFTPTVSGSYALAITENGCTDTSSCYNVTVVGLDHGLAHGIRIWPNPVASRLHLELGSLVAEGKLAVYDLQGKKLVQMPISNANTLELPMEGLAPGAYLLELRLEGELHRLRVLKE